jgi:hypothetical protein
MDHHIPKSITVGLRMRSVDVITAYEDDAHRLDDRALLDRATELKRILFSQDDDLLVESARRQKNHIHFAGLAYAHPLHISIGTCIKELELLAGATDSEDFSDKVVFLPVKCHDNPV